MTGTVTIALAPDGRAWVDGVELRAGSGGARATALAQVHRIAQRRRRAVLVAATEPDGRRWQFVVTVDGDVLEPHEATELMRDPDAEAVPAAYVARAAAVSSALAAGRAQEGLRLAIALEQDASVEHGTGHPYRLRARELRAHATAAAGLPGTGCELYLDVARGWADMRSPAYWGAARRAYALWHQADEQQPRMVWLGDQLREVLEAGGERAGRARAAVVRRIDELRLWDATG
ncbi:hypothetical protein ACWEV4_29800 [Streptomyces sp. NPDC003860]